MEQMKKIQRVLWLKIGNNCFGFQLSVLFVISRKAPSTLFTSTSALHSPTHTSTSSCPPQFSQCAAQREKLDH